MGVDPKTGEIILKMVCLARAYNALWFAHLTTLFFIALLLLFLLRNFILCSTILSLIVMPIQRRMTTLSSVGLVIFPNVRTDKLNYLLLLSIWFSASMSWISCVADILQSGDSSGSNIISSGPSSITQK